MLEQAKACRDHYLQALKYKDLFLKYSYILHIDDNCLKKSIYALDLKSKCKEPHLQRDFKVQLCVTLKIFCSYRLSV